VTKGGKQEIFSLRQCKVESVFCCFSLLAWLEDVLLLLAHEHTLTYERKIVSKKINSQFHMIHKLEQRATSKALSEQAFISFIGNRVLFHEKVNLLDNDNEEHSCSVDGKRSLMYERKLQVNYTCR